MKFNVDLASLYGGGIYVIRNNVNDKVYIGRTKSFQNRAIEHCNSMYSGKCNYKFKELIGLYPNIEFSFEVLERCLDIVKREEYYINKFKAVENGLNILHNDEEFGEIYRHSAKPKQKKEKKQFRAYELNVDDIQDFEMGYIRVKGKFVHSPEEVSKIKKEGFVLVEYESDKPKRKITKGHPDWRPADLGWIRQCKAYRKING